MSFCNTLEELAPRQAVDVLGYLAYQTDLSGNLLATFTYDSNRVPTSVVVGSDPNTSPRYYCVYNTHGDVVALVDGSGNIAARYSYDAFGAITDSSESFANGWSNPYRYDGIDRVRYDSETGLYWMRVRAYDPALGRFISRDPQGRTPLVFATQPYAYAGNNPLRNVDPSGQRYFNLSNPEQQAWRTPSGSTVVTTGPGKEPTDTNQCDDNCSGSSGGGGSKLGGGNGCHLGFLCGVKNWGLFAWGVAQVVGAAAVLGAALWGVIQTTEVWWLTATFKITKAAVNQGAFLLLGVVHTGTEDILDSLVSVSPWVRFALDMFQVVFDIGALVTVALTTYNAVAARGRQAWSFLKKLLNVLKQIGKNNIKGVYGLALAALGGFVVNTFVGGSQLVGDVRTAISDLQKAWES